MLFVQKLVPHAVLPTIAHPGEDLAYDLYATEDTAIIPRSVVKVPTGIAAVFYDVGKKYGLLVRDRSSMALKGAFVVAGVIDYGYHGEICVCMRYDHPDDWTFHIKRGDKIAQLIPIPIVAHGALEVESLDDNFLSKRGTDGFGSTGK